MGKPINKDINATIDRAAQICGGFAVLARELGIRQSAISNWKARGSEIGPLFCVSIERITSGAVTRQDLRPNDWREIWPELAELAEA